MDVVHYNLDDLIWYIYMYLFIFKAILGTSTFPVYPKPIILDNQS